MGLGASQRVTRSPRLSTTVNTACSGGWNSKRSEPSTVNVRTVLFEVHPVSACSSRTKLEPVVVRCKVTFTAP